MNDNFANEKSADILKSYERVIKSLGEKARYMSKESLVDIAFKSKAPRFYVSYEYARRIIWEKLNGIESARRKLIKEMHDELFRRYKDLNKIQGSYLILNDIIRSEAPSFYLKKGHFRNIIYKQLKSK